MNVAPSFIALALLLALMQTGCASLTVTPQTPTAEVSTVRAQAFRLSARLSVRQAQKLDSATLVWTKSATAQTLDITGPLGVQVAKISQTSGEAATLSRGDGQTVERAESLDALVTQAIGVSVQLARIVDWVQLIGLPPSGDMVTVKIDQTDWQVAAETTQDLGGKRIAQRIVARSFDTTIKLFVDDWQNLDAPP